MRMGVSDDVRVAEQAAQAKGPKAHRAWRDAYEKARESKENSVQDCIRIANRAAGIGGFSLMDYGGGEFRLPPDHLAGMVVHPDGASCLTCHFLGPDRLMCGNELFVAWNGGSGKLPAPAERYCSDWYQPRRHTLPPLRMVKDMDGKEIRPSDQAVVVQKPGDPDDGGWGWAKRVDGDMVEVDVVWPNRRLRKFPAANLRVHMDQVEHLPTKEVYGLVFVEENPAGSVREWRDPDGKLSGWTHMHFPYGYVDGHLSADGEELDVYLGPDEAAKYVYVVHQRKAPDFKVYDEDKVMLRFRSPEAAEEAYWLHRRSEERHLDPGPFGGMSMIPVDSFLAKLTRRTGKGKIRAERMGEPAQKVQMDQGSFDQWAAQLRSEIRRVFPGQVNAVAQLGADRKEAIEPLFRQGMSPADALRELRPVGSHLDRGDTHAPHHPDGTPAPPLPGQHDEPATAAAFKPGRVELSAFLMEEFALAAASGHQLGVCSVCQVAVWEKGGVVLAHGQVACEGAGKPPARTFSVEMETPPGREEQVKELKKNPDVDNPWAIAWWSYNQGKKAERMSGQMARFKDPEVEKEYQALRAASKDYLEGEVKRSHRVSDLRGLSKGDLINMILVDKFGERRTSTASRMQRGSFGGLLRFDNKRGEDGKVRVGLWDRAATFGEKPKDGVDVSFTPETFGQMLDNWLKRGEKLALCYNHQSAYVEENGAPAPALAFYDAAAIVKDGQILRFEKLGVSQAQPPSLEALKQCVMELATEAEPDPSPDGLWWCRAEVTEKGEELLPNFKYLSPMFVPDGTDEFGAAQGYTIYDLAATNTAFQAGCLICFDRGGKVRVKMASPGQIVECPVCKRGVLVVGQASVIEDHYPPGAPRDSSAVKCPGSGLSALKMKPTRMDLKVGDKVEVKNAQDQRKTGRVKEIRAGKPVVAYPDGSEEDVWGQEVRVLSQRVKMAKDQRGQSLNVGDPVQINVGPGEGNFGDIVSISGDQVTVELDPDSPGSGVLTVRAGSLEKVHFVFSRGGKMDRKSATHLALLSNGKKLRLRASSTVLAELMAERWVKMAADKNGDEIHEGDKVNTPDGTGVVRGVQEGHSSGRDLMVDVQGQGIIRYRGKDVEVMDRGKRRKLSVKSVQAVKMARDSKGQELRLGDRVRGGEEGKVESIADGWVKVGLPSGLGAEFEGKDLMKLERRLGGSGYASRLTRSPSSRRMNGSSKEKTKMARRFDEEMAKRFGVAPDASPEVVAAAYAKRMEEAKGLLSEEEDSGKLLAESTRLEEEAQAYEDAYGEGEEDAAPKPHVVMRKLAARLAHLARMGDNTVQVPTDGEPPGHEVVEQEEDGPVEPFAGKETPEEEAAEEAAIRARMQSFEEEEEEAEHLAKMAVRFGLDPKTARRREILRASAAGSVSVSKMEKVADQRVQKALADAEQKRQKMERRKEAELLARDAVEGGYPADQEKDLVAFAVSSPEAARRSMKVYLDKKVELFSRVTRMGGPSGASRPAPNSSVEVREHGTTRVVKLSMDLSSMAKAYQSKNKGMKYEQALDEVMKTPEGRAAYQEYVRQLA